MTDDVALRRKSGADGVDLPKDKKEPPFPGGERGRRPHELVP